MRSLVVIAALAVVVSFAGSWGGTAAGGIPVFICCALVAFGLQWLAFVHAYRNQTEKYYDLIGSITYLSVTLLALTLTSRFDPRSLLLALCVAIWAARLGLFLFARIRADGSDSRFDKIKPNPLRFFVTWNIQGLWVLFTAACALAAITASEAVALDTFALIGAVLWLVGFTVEVVADAQKRRYRAQFGSGGFITTGLWAYSRHPNYVGEILLWLGVAIIALPQLSQVQYVTLLSPVFVYVLLTRVSGVPLLERKADARWGGEAEYEAYKARTPVLFPLGR